MDLYTLIFLMELTEKVLAVIPVLCVAFVMACVPVAAAR